MYRAIAMIVLLGACPPWVAAAAPAQRETLAAAEQVEPDPQAPQVGTGPHRVQFVLHDTVSAAPAAMRPFALSHTAFDLPFVREEKDVYQGITDARGRTPVFAFEQAPPAAGWVLLERFGSGPFGERMRLHGGGDHAVAAMPYEVVVCGQTPRLYRGVSNARGETAYVATSRVVDLLLYIDSDSDSGADADAPTAAIQPGDGALALQRCREHQGQHP